MKLCLFGVVGLAFEIQFAGELTGNGRERECAKKKTSNK